MAVTAADIVAALEAAAADNVGVASVTIDGTTVRYEGAAKIAEALKYWRGVAGRVAGRRPRIASIKIPG